MRNIPRNIPRNTLHIARSIRDWYIIVGVVLTFAIAFGLRFLGSTTHPWLGQPGHIIGTLIFIDGLLVCWQFAEGIVHERREAQSWHIWASLALAIGALLAIGAIAAALYTAPITWTTMLFLMGTSRLLVILAPFLLLTAQVYIERSLKSK